VFELNIVIWLFVTTHQEFVNFLKLISILHDFDYQLYALILGAFAKLRKATISFVMSVCLSVYLPVRPHRTRLPLDGFP
jgi:hypothetical protein